MPFTLPSRADAERFRTLAKTLVADLRTGDQSALLRMRAWFPDVSRETAKLSQAQMTMAREYGFASWRAMIAEVERRAQKRRARLARKEAALGDISALAEQLFTLAEASDLDRLWQAFGIGAMRMERTRELMLRSPERHSRFIDVLVSGLSHQNRGHALHLLTSLTRSGMRAAWSR